MQKAYDISLPVRLAEICNASHTALLVYDMQIGIRDQISDGNKITDSCAVALAAARQAGMRVVFTRHLSNPTPWIGLTQYRTAMAWQHTDNPEAVKSWFLRNAPSSAIVPELAPTDDDLVLEKIGMSAFEGTPLAYALRDCGVVGIAIAGIALEIGIEPTVRHATDLGFVPIVLTDACGFGNKEAAERTIATMRFVGEAELTDVATFTRLLGDTPQRP
ncbi:MAG TPA: cysteine hydrolase [Gemmatimonadaceae bacterium]|nr:cysteine hydrolase [Gemmatimonadaceae bacterium]